MIERAERQDTDGNVAAGKYARDGCDAAVAAADHDSVDLVIPGLPQGALGACFQLRTRKKIQAARDPIPREGCGKRFAQRPAVTAYNIACRVVEEHGHPDALLLRHGTTR